MGQLYANIAIGFDIYITFFVVFIIPVVTIIGSSFVCGIITGLYYKFTFGR